MIERETKKGPEVKVCQRPSCKVPFERPNNMKQKHWDQIQYCSRHRKSGGSPLEPRLGHYIVNNPLIDKFLYACKPTG